MTLPQNHLVQLSGSSYCSVKNWFYWISYLHITFTIRNQSLIYLVFFHIVTSIVAVPETKIVKQEPQPQTKPKIQNEKIYLQFVHNRHYQINKTAEINVENTLKVNGLLLFDCAVDAVTDWHSETLCKYFPLQTISLQQT